MTEQTEEKTQPNTSWVLRDIKLEMITWGEKKGFYEGKISFQNSEFESFSFKIYPEMAQKYIDLISEDIAIHADSLGKRIKESLGLEKK